MLYQRSAKLARQLYTIGLLESIKGGCSQVHQLTRYTIRMQPTLQNPLRTQHSVKGKKYRVEYYECESFDHIDIQKVRQVYGVCFDGNKIVIVCNGKRGPWGLVGGSRENDETIEETLIREVKEESNMQVLSWEPLGVQVVHEPSGKTVYQLRVYAVVKPYGPFTADPGGNVQKIKHIDPKEYRKYFNWGHIGEEIIRRASHMHAHQK